MRVTIFTEYNDAMKKPESELAYPEGMNECLRSLLASEHDVKMVVQAEGDDGSMLTDELLSETDVLVWWAHHYHARVSDSVADMVCEYVNRGMGLIALHSAHKSKVFTRLLGTSGDLSWREAEENERLWTVDISHPIARDMEKPYIDIPHEEMYGEPFFIPTPDELVFIGWFKGGEVFRSGCVFKRGRGKIFYFQPGHETLPTYKLEGIRKIILNAVEYVKSPTGVHGNSRCVKAEVPLETI